jgi:hypothetical protein
MVGMGFTFKLDREKIWSLYQEGFTVTRVAQKVGANRVTVSRIISKLKKEIGGCDDTQPPAPSSTETHVNDEGNVHDTTVSAQRRERPA